jgi:hypothetical protein
MKETISGRPCMQWIPTYNSSREVMLPTSAGMLPPILFHIKSLERKLKVVSQPGACRPGLNEQTIHTIISQLNSLYLHYFHVRKLAKLRS